MRMKKKRHEKERKKEKDIDRSPRATLIIASSHVKLELDLRGERYEDAINKLDQYIDDALLANHSQVTIIHGTGTGALREGVKNYAREHTRIKEIIMNGEKEGGSGVTIITITRKGEEEGMKTLV